MVECLLEYSPDLDSPDRFGFTPVDLAEKYNHTGITSALLHVGASENESSTYYPDVNDTLQSGEAVAWSLFGGGWAVHTANHLLIFNYMEPENPPDEPCLRNGCVHIREIYFQDNLVLPTCNHPQEAFHTLFASEVITPHIRYVVNWSMEDRQNWIQMLSRNTVELDDLTIHSIEPLSTQSGYLVEVDGLKIFHMGDWGWSLDPDNIPLFMGEIDALAENITLPVDVVMMPVNGYSDEFLPVINHVLETLQPRIFLPESAYGQFVQDEEFKHDLQEMGSTTIVHYAIHPGDCFVL